MLNKYYNNCQKHVAKCSKVSKISEIFRISFIEHSRFIFDFLLRGLVYQFLPFIFEKNPGQLISYP